MKYGILISGLLLLCHSTFAADSTAVSALPANLRVAEVIPLPEVGGNLSGITYNADTKTYFMIQNNSYQILEYDTNFKPLRTLRLKNLPDKDTEDIVYLGNDRYALTSEDNSILVFNIKPGQSELDLSPSRQDVQHFRLPSASKDNKGLEGVCYASGSSSSRGSFFAVQEQRPKKVYTFQWPSNDKDYSRWNDFGLRELFDTDAVMKHVLSDLSGCTVEKSSKHLFILSHESSRLMELTLQGKVLRTIDIPAVAEQFEGVTFGPQKEVVLVSEPNVVVIMK